MGLRHYELTDPVLWRIAEIIHEADLDDERSPTPHPSSTASTNTTVAQCY
jgi:hypothetical protein